MILPFFSAHGLFTFLFASPKRKVTKEKGDFFESLRAKKRPNAVIYSSTQQHGAGILPVIAAIGLFNRHRFLYFDRAGVASIYGSIKAPSGVELHRFYRLKSLVVACFYYAWIPGGLVRMIRNFATPQVLYLALCLPT